MLTIINKAIDSLNIYVSAGYAIIRSYKELQSNTLPDNGIIYQIIYFESVNCFTCDT
jgi:hypothetical protein